MGVLPLEFLNEQTRQTLGLTGFETFDIEGLSDTMPARARLNVIARSEAGERRFQVLARVDTPEELNYYRHGGILHYVLRGLAKKAGMCYEE
jgi:aconitate hydratase